MHKLLLAGTAHSKALMLHAMCAAQNIPVLRAEDMCRPENLKGAPLELKNIPFHPAHHELSFIDKQAIETLERGTFTTKSVQRNVVRMNRPRIDTLHGIQPALGIRLLCYEVWESPDLWWLKPYVSIQFTR